MNLGDVAAFMAVARGQGFREAARATASSASTLSEAVRRLEAQVGVRLLNRTTRSVTLTEAGAQLLDRLTPALGEVEAALDGANRFRDRPKGRLRLNVPSAVRMFLPPLIEAFLREYPEVVLEITVEDSFVDMLAAGCDAGIRYDERLEQDMIAVPIGPRTQRFAVAAAPAYLAAQGRPAHPRELLQHRAIRLRFASGALPRWPFERAGEQIEIDPAGPLVVSTAGAADYGISAAIAGLGLIALFEDWLRPALDSGALEPVLEDWWVSFPGPFLYYPSRRFMPAPLRAFIDFIGRAAALPA